MEEAAGLIAPAATMIAAMMTAANLGARITGSGFVVFTVGSIAWSVVGFTSGQTNLLATNLFLTLVNLIGIWRWLGRQREYEDGARRAAKRSRLAGSPSLFAASAFGSLPVSDIRGEMIGRTVDAMIECESGCLSYVVIASGGIGGIDETLRAVPATMLDCHADGLVLLMSVAEYEKRDTLDGAAWPARPPRGEEAADAPVGTSASVKASAAAGERVRGGEREAAYGVAQGEGCTQSPDRIWSRRQKWRRVRDGERLGGAAGGSWPRLAVASRAARLPRRFNPRMAEQSRQAGVSRSSPRRRGLFPRSAPAPPTLP